jgi:predicted nucleic acid-binding protein
LAIRRWVVNASPLILLGKTDLLDLLTGLADSVIVPQSVADEVGTKPDGTLTIEALVRNVRWALVKNDTVSPEVLAWDFGAGAIQIIVAA